jgi:hypothetical protein
MTFEHLEVEGTLEAEQPRVQEPDVGASSERLEPFEEPTQHAEPRDRPSNAPQRLEHPSGDLPEAAREYVRRLRGRGEIATEWRSRRARSALGARVFASVDTRLGQSFTSRSASSSEASACVSK